MYFWWLEGISIDSVWCSSICMHVCICIYTFVNVCICTVYMTYGHGVWCLALSLLPHQSCFKCTLDVAPSWMDLSTQRVEGLKELFNFLVGLASHKNNRYLSNQSTVTHYLIGCCTEQKWFSKIEWRLVLIHLQKRTMTKPLFDDLNLKCWPNTTKCVSVSKHQAVETLGVIHPSLWGALATEQYLFSQHGWWYDTDLHEVVGVTQTPNICSNETKKVERFFLNFGRT